MSTESEERRPERPSRGRAWVEVRGDALLRNLRRVRATVGSAPRMIPVVKADGYGLGVARVVEVLEAEDPWGYGVATVEEGVELRALGVVRPLLVFSPIPPGEVVRAVRHRLTLAVSDTGLLARIAAAAEAEGAAASVHLEIDTGMGRSGFEAATAGTWGPRLREIAEGDRVRVEGCFTHFHSADEGRGEGIDEQAGRFAAALEALHLPEGGELIRHLANSAAALRRPELAADAVRPGIFLYGGRVGAGAPEPEPVASVRARVGLVREVPPGTTVGYGATYRARGRERWATAGIGYGDGLPRSLSNRGEAILRGRRVPVVGRISMDMTVVDISEVPEVEPGEIATFLGSDGGEEISLEEVAERAGTIGYEILTGLSPRLPRVWLEGPARAAPEGGNGDAGTGRG